MRALSITAVFVSMALASLAVACGSDDGGDSAGRDSDVEFSCASVEGNSCIEYGGTGQPIETLRDACTRQGGTPGAGCSRSGAQGACTLAAGEAYVRNIYYGLDPGALDVAEQTCTQNQGVWSDSALAR